MRVSTGWTLLVLLVLCGAGAGVAGDMQMKHTADALQALTAMLFIGLAVYVMAKYG